MNLTELRCERVNCHAHIEGSSPTEVLLLADALDWSFTGTNTADISNVYCTTHRTTPSGDRYVVECSTCDWSTDEEAEINRDPNVVPRTEEEAKDAKRRHDCGDWREDFPNCHIRTPDDLRREHAQMLEYQEKGRERRKREQTEKEEELARSESAAALQSRNERDAARYRMIITLFPVWVCLMELIIMIAFMLGYVTH